MDLIIFQFDRQILILRIGFMFYVEREFYVTPFKEKRNKWIWFLFVFVFGYFGYSIYLAFRRRLILKRVFSPKFNKRN
ncbi:PLDc N-terminal domain-containing protein [Aureisphaera sp. CAU 1614]|uniref:PLDc N-terminal domain-containing protein n=1 Tax=Halomarinibacterium sedimenti TaxID=2857106 RepID=A0A9X1JXX2_9FLAO|nr:PLDc N-terminal domain-containing protein [Halomarinibacterium sedimenti]